MGDHVDTVVIPAAAILVNRAGVKYVRGCLVRQVPPHAERLQNSTPTQLAHRRQPLDAQRYRRDVPIPVRCPFHALHQGRRHPARSLDQLEVRHGVMPNRPTVLQDDHGTKVELGTSPGGCPEVRRIYCSDGLMETLADGARRPGVVLLRDDLRRMRLRPAPEELICGTATRRCDPESLVRRAQDFRGFFSVFSPDQQPDAAHP